MVVDKVDKVSVIIPTYNGAHKLPLILESLKTQTRQPDEILVVIDGSTDNTVDVLKEWQNSIHQLRYIIQENKGRAAVKNYGVRYAAFQLLIFFDDDMILSDNCVEEHLKHHRIHPMSIAGGAQVDKDPETNNDIQHFKQHLSKKWNESLKSHTDRPLDKDHLFFTAANFSISKELFFSLGGFDDGLNDAEDFDLAARAFLANVPVYYNYSAFAWHNDPVTAEKFIKRLRQYNEGQQQLRLLKSEIFENFNRLNISQPKGLKRRVFAFFAHTYWVRWIDNSKWKYILPRSLRYKIYDIVITANGVYFPDKVSL